MVEWEVASNGNARHPISQRDATQWVVGYRGGLTDCVRGRKWIKSWVLEQPEKLGVAWVFDSPKGVFIRT